MTGKSKLCSFFSVLFSTVGTTAKPNCLDCRKSLQQLVCSWWNPVSLVRVVLIVVGKWDCCGEALNSRQTAGYYDGWVVRCWPHYQTTGSFWRQRWCTRLILRSKRRLPCWTSKFVSNFPRKLVFSYKRILNIDFCLSDWSPMKTRFHHECVFYT